MNSSPDLMWPQIMHLAFGNAHKIHMRGILKFMSGTLECLYNCYAHMVTS